MLISWREEVAQQWNVPVNRVARDEMLFELIRQVPQSVRQLSQIRGFNPRQVEQFGEGLIKALRRPPTSLDRTAPKERQLSLRWSGGRHPAQTSSRKLTS
jgi:ribonuclease D